MSVNIKNRNPPKLIVGDIYWICYGDNIAESCKLIELVDDNRVKLEMLPKNKRVKFNINGKKIFLVSTIFTVFRDEIGLTPIEAVINTIT